MIVSIVYTRNIKVAEISGIETGTGSMKKALILHGWGASPDDHWFQEEKSILESKGYVVSVPSLPSKYMPTENNWLKVVDEFSPKEDSVLIGHSLGGTTVLEYLEHSDIKVDKVFLVVTPIEYTEPLRLDNISGFKLYLHSVATDAFLKMCDYDEIYDWEKIKSNANEFVLIYKTDDVRVPAIQGEILAEKLGAKLTIVEGEDHGHIFNLDLINGELNL